MGRFLTWHICLYLLIICAFVIATTIAPFPVTGFSGNSPHSQQSTTGPFPPPEVVQRDALKTLDTVNDLLSSVTLPVPAYSWRHGCGPTAAGMILGYYDENGFPDLIPGPTQIQTDAVNQAIASGGEGYHYFPPGLEEHFEDYAQPMDSSPNLLSDEYITANRIPHSANSLADFMNTSRSIVGNYYGWSWSNDVGPAFKAFVKKQNLDYLPTYQYYYGFPAWSVLTTEIDGGRPMIFLVDTNGDGSTDHFVTVIGYRTSPTLQYASWDTWSTSTVRWENYMVMSRGTPWGVMAVWSFGIQHLNPTPTVTPTPAPTITPPPSTWPNNYLPNVRRK